MVSRHLGIVRVRRESIQPDRDHHRRDVGDVVHQVRRRVDDALLALVGVDPLVGREVRTADRRVRLGDGRLQVGIVDDHPAVALAVPAHRSVAGDVDALEQQLTRDGAREVEALAHLLRRGEQVVGGGEVDVRHGVSLSCARAALRGDP